MAGRFSIKQGAKGFMFNLKAGNSAVILTSEQYAARSGVTTGIASVKKNCSSRKVVDE